MNQNTRELMNYINSRKYFPISHNFTRCIITNNEARNFLYANLIKMNRSIYLISQKNIDILQTMNISDDAIFKIYKHSYILIHNPEIQRNDYDNNNNQIYDYD